MSPKKLQELFFRRNLPHLHPSEGTFFITYRLAGSIPASVINRLRESIAELDEKGPEDIFFEGYDALLDRGSKINHLSYIDIAGLNKSALHHYDKVDYDLICYCIMSNHVHIVFKQRDGSRTLSEIMHSIKRFTSKESNKILKRTGKFWQEESYDRFVRNARELRNTVEYVINNPVKAGLVSNWKDWPHTYVNFDNL